MQLTSDGLGRLLGPSRGKQYTEFVLIESGRRKHPVDVLAANAQFGALGKTSNRFLDRLILHERVSREVRALVRGRPVICESPTNLFRRRGEPAHVLLELCTARTGISSAA